VDRPWGYPLAPWSQSGWDRTSRYVPIWNNL